MNKPNFLCVGTQKAGTTSLYNILKQHSQIFLPDKKELHFFDWQENFEKGTEYYFKIFQNSEKYLARGEITPNYIYKEYVPKRIFDILGKDVKLIFMLRNPSSRAFSNYKMRVGRGFEKKSFNEVIKIEINELNKKTYKLEHNYINRGFYDVQIKRFLDIFERKNMFFIHFEEDFLQNREQTIKNLFNFLEVDENQTIGVNIKSTPGVNSKSKKSRKDIKYSTPYKSICKKIDTKQKTTNKYQIFFYKN